MPDPITAVREAFPDAVLETATYRGTPILTIKADSLLDVGRFLRDEPALRYDLLSDLTVVDRLQLEDGNAHNARFHGIYQLRSVERDGDLLQIKTPLTGFASVVKTTAAKITANTISIRTNMFRIKNSVFSVQSGQSREMGRAVNQ